MTSAIAKDHPLPAQYAAELLIVKSGDGVHLTDVAGKRYLDFAGGIAVNALGYGREDLARAAYEQMLRLPHISNVYANEPALELARRLRATGDWAAVFFGNSGSEANEAALKYARLHALRTKGADHHRILCFTNAFHGRTLGALSCTPTAKYQDPFKPLVPGVVVAPYNDEAALERTLDAGFAAVIVEVVQGEGGLACMTPSFAAALNRLCRKHDVLLIADEVQTGLCRTGDLFASRGVGLQPDLLTLAKPLAGGLPLSAVLIPDKVNRLIHFGEHGTTFGGGPVTTAVALKVWDIVSKPSFAEEVKAKGLHLRSLLEGMRSRRARVVEVRGRGLLAGFACSGDLAALVARLQEKGLLVLRSGADAVRIAPPLVITEEGLAEGVAIIEEALE
jgi:acetylornithine/N-succinyldiaminopimelate aminotransferase